MFESKDHYEQRLGNARRALAQPDTIIVAAPPDNAAQAALLTEWTPIAPEPSSAGALPEIVPVVGEAVVMVSPTAAALEAVADKPDVTTQTLDPHSLFPAAGQTVDDFIRLQLTPHGITYPEWRAISQEIIDAGGMPADAINGWPEATPQG
jgi:hypothetical protein